ncbi:hypothetical protein EMCG_05416 [[Emmonsia] crescens]|uniref:Uncharacterized protein n=1 Tax=[Emmonsia] crescens TaxID=73230 RepID=A0A0G2HP49_9EURO|nr:hypothetical protein EMCG_05416 [Emmonsia crescens UAMH 3008]
MNTDIVDKSALSIIHSGKYQSTRNECTRPFVDFIIKDDTALEVFNQLKDIDNIMVRAADLLSFFDLLPESVINWNVTRRFSTKCKWKESHRCIDYSIWDLNDQSIEVNKERHIVIQITAKYWENIDLLTIINNIVNKIAKSSMKTEPVPLLTDSSPQKSEDEIEPWKLSKFKMQALSPSKLNSDFICEPESQGFQKLKSSVEKHSRVWSLIFKDQKWLSVAMIEFGLNPVLIGSNLDAYYDQRDPTHGYMALAFRDYTGDLRYMRALFFNSLHKHTFNKNTLEVKFQSGITLNVSDSLLSDMSIIVKPPGKIFSCRHRNLQTFYLCWHGDNHLRKIASEDIRLLPPMDCYEFKGIRGIRDNCNFSSREDLRLEPPD